MRLTYINQTTELDWQSLRTDTVGGSPTTRQIPAQSIFRIPANQLGFVGQFTNA